MSQLLDYLMSVLGGIFDWIQILFTYFGTAIATVINGVRVAMAMFGVVLNLPSYFTWLPGTVLAIVVHCFTIIFIVKVISIIK